MPDISVGVQLHRPDRADTGTANLPHQLAYPLRMGRQQLGLQQAKQFAMR
jgi:hypothetical protein